MKSNISTRTDLDRYRDLAKVTQSSWWEADYESLTFTISDYLKDLLELDSHVISFDEAVGSAPSISIASLSIPFCRLLTFQRVSSAFSFVQSAVFLLSSSSASATLICPNNSPRLFFRLRSVLLGCRW